MCLLFRFTSLGNLCFRYFWNFSIFSQRSWTIKHLNTNESCGPESCGFLPQRFSPIVSGRAVYLPERSWHRQRILWASTVPLSWKSWFISSGIVPFTSGFFMPRSSLEFTLKLTVPFYFFRQQTLFWCIEGSE